MMLSCQKPESQDNRQLFLVRKGHSNHFYNQKFEIVLSVYLKKESTLILNNAHDNCLLN